MSTCVRKLCNPRLELRQFSVVLENAGRVILRGEGAGSELVTLGPSETHRKGHFEDLTEEVVQGVDGQAGRGGRGGGAGSGRCQFSRVGPLGARANRCRGGRGCGPFPCPGGRWIHLHQYFLRYKT